MLTRRGGAMGIFVGAAVAAVSPYAGVAMILCKAVAELTDELRVQCSCRGEETVW